MHGENRGSIPRRSIFGDEVLMGTRLTGSQKITGSTPVFSINQVECEKVILSSTLIPPLFLWGVAPRVGTLFPITHLINAGVAQR